MLISQVEYRQPLSGRHGMVYWLGAGTLAEEFDQLKTNGSTLSALATDLKSSSELTCV